MSQGSIFRFPYFLPHAAHYIRVMAFYSFFPVKKQSAHYTQVNTVIQTARGRGRETRIYIVYIKKANRSQGWNLLGFRLFLYCVTSRRIISLKSIAVIPIITITVSGRCSMIKRKKRKRKR